LSIKGNGRTARGQSEECKLYSAEMQSGKTFEGQQRFTVV